MLKTTPEIPRHAISVTATELDRWIRGASTRARYSWCEDTTVTAVAFEHSTASLKFGGYLLLSESASRRLCFAFIYGWLEAFRQHDCETREAFEAAQRRRDAKRRRLGITGTASTSAR